MWLVGLYVHKNNLEVEVWPFAHGFSSFSRQVVLTELSVDARKDEMKGQQI